MRNMRVQAAVCIALICALAITLVAVRYAQNNQSENTIPLKLRFIGEYSQNGGEWQPLTDATRLNALHGDLLLRGHFDSQTSMIHAYLDHIYFSVSVNGEVVAEYAPSCDDGPPNDCGSVWREWTFSATPEQGEMEIRLINPHSAGNPRAYDEFLENLYNGVDYVFDRFILNPSEYISRYESFGRSVINSLSSMLKGQLWRVAGFVVMILSILLLGVAMADTLQNSLLGLRLWTPGLLALFAAGTMIFDTLDISLWSRIIALNTYASQICRMLCALFLALWTAANLRGRRRKIAHGMAAIEAATILGVVSVCLITGISICETHTVWLAVQAAVFVALFVLCAVEFRVSGRDEQRSLATTIFLLTVVLAELGNARFGWWSRNLALNAAFLLVFAIYLVRMAIDVPRKYRSAKHAEQLERDLTQSRISIMLSQIQPHFLYNALNSIGYLCEKDPPAAKTAVDEFAVYLRGNLDSLKRTKPVPFDKELEHVRTYLSLEKMRFDDELRVVWDIQAVDFMLPALSVQPLVENAVRYGVGKKPGGGKVTIASRECTERFEISIIDDGTGYDPYAVQSDGRTHIGIDNVRQRLKAMVGGSLVIRTERGNGTTVTVIIPKEGAKI